MLFDDTIEIDGIKLTAHYIESLSLDDREKLIDPIFRYFRNLSFIFPDDINKVKQSYKNLCLHVPDLSSKELYNNSSLATDVCKYFCHTFYYATGDARSRNMIELFNDDDVLKRVIDNRLGRKWGDLTNQSFNFSSKMIIQGMRSMRLINMTSIFKPSIAKYICTKYSNEGDTVYDYSAGFCGRILGAASCNRKYIGADPLTTDDINKAIKELELKNCEAHKIGSEHFCLEENSVDLCFSSPPYYDQEFYSKDETQAYNKGEEYFFNVYWKKTLKNCKYMLKPGKKFVLNVKNQEKMLDMAKEMFILEDEILLKTVRSHLNKKNISAVKHESIYIFNNDI